MIKEDDENDAELLVNACLMVEETNEMSETNSNNFLKCELCHQIMQSPDLRSLHYVLNHGCSICSVCSQVSITMNSFKIHVRSNHAQFSCDLCEIVFLTYGELLKHRNNFHELFKCPLCNFEFFSESHVDLHIFKFHRISVTAFMLTHNYVAEWSESNQTYYCNMCGVKKCKIDVFSHFLDHHQISLLPLAQKFMSQNLNIRVIGVDSEIDGQFTQNVSFCKGCSEHVSEDVPLSAHKFICLGDILCKICFKSQDNLIIRDSHITKEHKNYPCVLGCSNRIVFNVEDKLYEHCLTVHDVKPCYLCGSFIRCAEGLMKQHLQTCHSYYRSDEILSTDSIFNVNCGNMTVSLICSLCDFDALIQISSVADLFKHLNYHSVSLKAAFHFLEKNNAHQSLYLRLKELRHLDTQKASIQTDGSEQKSDESCHLFYTENINSVSRNMQNPIHSYPGSGYSLASDSQMNDSQIDKPIKMNLDKVPNSMLETNGKIEPSPFTHEVDGFKVNNVECIGEQNVKYTINGSETSHVLNKEKLVSESMFPGPSSSKNEEEIEEFEDPGTPRVEPVSNCSETNTTSELKYELNTLEDKQRGSDELISNAGITNEHFVGENERTHCTDVNLIGVCLKNGEKDVDHASNEALQIASHSNEIVDEHHHHGALDEEMAEDHLIDEVHDDKEEHDKEDDKEEHDKEDDDKEEDDDDDCSNMKSENENDPDNLLDKNMRLNLFNIKPDIDPCEVECVVTDTSDIESDSEILMNNEAEVDNVVNDSACSSRDVKFSFPKSLPGLSRMEAGPDGFACEVCCGKFEPHEGIRELVKHMRSLHGFSCNFNGLKLSAAFKFNRAKTGSSMNMQPGLVCPECLTGWKSKRLLRKHVSINHGLDWMEKPSPSGPLSYQCRYCKQSFWRAIECFAHEKDNHSDRKGYECHVCSDIQLRKVILNKHLKQTHPLEKLHSYVSFKCKQCSKLYPTYKMLKSHVRTRHPSCMLFRCPHCHSTLRSKKRLAEHVRKQHTSNKGLECDHCGRKMYSKRALAIHIRLKHDKTTKYRYKCRLCEKTFDSKEERDTHYKGDHAKENLYRCECGKGFASKSGLYSHKQVHLMSIDAFKCEHCDKLFSRRDSFTEHLQIHSGPRHTCPHCAKEFVQRSNMVRHIRIHTGEKPYKCSFCDKMFSDKGACNAHIRVHTRAEVSACPFCDKTFSKKQKLKYHIRKHTGEGLVPCKVCGKSFTHNFLLKEHILTHQLQLSCEECGKVFNSAKYLQRHVKSTHNPSHVYSCQLCTKTFTKEAGAKKHLISHASYKTLLCPLCRKHYTTLNSLKKHLTTIHKLQKEHPDFKSALDKLSAERVELMKTQKEIDFDSVMVSVPISQLKTINQNNNNGDEDYDRANRRAKKTISMTNAKSTDAKDDSVSSIGERVLRNSRKSRPKCLVELDDEDETSNESFTNQQPPSPAPVPVASNSNDQKILRNVQKNNISETNPNDKKPKSKKKSSKSSKNRGKSH